MSDNIKSVLMTLLDLTIIVITTLVLAHSMGALTGFPKGVDAYGHLTKVRIVLDHFPHTDWNPLWDAGAPMFAWSYPPLPFLTSAALVRVFGLTIEAAMTGLTFTSFCVMMASIYGFVLNVTHNRVAGLIASLSPASAPAFWAWWIGGGNYPRVIGMMFTGLSLLLTPPYLNVENARRKRLLLVGLTASVSLALMNHLLVGALTLVVVTTYLFLALPGAKRFTVPVTIAIIALLAASYWYGPLLFASRPGSRFVGGISYAPVTDFLNYIWPTWELNDTLTPFMLLATIILLLFTAWSGVIRRVGKSPPLFAGLLTLGLGALGCMGYQLIGHLPGYPKELYINGLPPYATFYLLALFIAPLNGLLLGITLNGLEIDHRWRPVLSIGLIGAVVLFTAFAMPLLRSGMRDVSAYPATEVVTQNLIKLDADERNYRLGTDNASVAGWFNYLYDVPQTRDYFAQGMVYPNWHFWQESSIWDPGGDPAEANFLLDWHAVRWLVVGETHHAHDKFLAQPGAFQVINKTADDAWYEFECLNTTPILAAVNTPTALVIASDNGYETVFRSLAHSNTNSQVLIPVRSGEFADDLSLDELARFDAVVLYNFDFHDEDTAFALLSDYVRNGGGLVIETSNSPLDNAPFIAEPCPVEQTTATNYGTEWNFISADHEILEGIDLSAFDPAIYDGGPWGVSSAEEADIRDWAQPILFTNGHPIIVAGQYGQGRVAWTGMNLPYHILSYRNQEESRLLAQMIEWVAGGGRPQPDYEAHFIHPQKRVVKVLSPAKGVLFKESHFPNWHAYVGDRPAAIYHAGPDFMYLPLPQTMGYPLEVIFEYKRCLFEWSTVVVSIATLAGVVAYGVWVWLRRPSPKRSEHRSS